MKKFVVCSYCKPPMIVTAPCARAARRAYRREYRLTPAEFVEAGEIH